MGRCPRLLGDHEDPRDFGFLRSRWSCAILALLLRDRHDVTARRETVRRWLHRGTLVYRRPRLVLKPDEEERQAKTRPATPAQIEGSVYPKAKAA